jgi:hypothetical protein
VDVAAHAGVTNERLAKGIVWGDFDDDGDADLYVSNHNGHNRLYRNRGDGTFEDVAAAAGVQAPWSSHGVVTWDYDNDGVLDLYVAVASPEHAPEVDEDRVDELAPLQATVASQLGLSDAEEYGRLYRGLGDMRFRDVTKEMGLDRVVLTGGLGVGDLDGDGYLDLYLGTSYPGYEGLLPNVMYHNRGGTGFSDVTTAGGFGHLQKTLGLAFADLDADGDQDVFVRAGGMFAGDAFGDVLFDNPGFGAHWLAVRLAGRKSNHSAIGARIRCVVEHDGRQRTIHRRVGEGGSAGAGPLEQWIGLGDAVEVSTLEITWPSGTRQTLRNVPVDQRLDITEAVSD